MLYGRDFIKLSIITAVNLAIGDYNNDCEKIIADFEFAELLLRYLFEGVDKEYITTIDPISENQKTAILESGFLRGSEVCSESIDQTGLDYVLWYVTGIENDSLSLGRCDSLQELIIKVYKKRVVDIW